ncbi:MAG: Phosphate acyltransferase [Candidatus Anoxychlamydiales bacterium]|nr:Phosphate acyltransferase [Candidatus Anoxychlamydiales bacterium]NGX36538.1 Phosphate acyltransferase [Candidatus Anoxychlamydiales bacterium]
MRVRLGIDLMESANKFDSLLEELVLFAKKREDVDFVFFAKKDQKSKIEEIEKKQKLSIETILTEHSISMDEDPLLAIRRKKDCPIFAGMRYLKDDKIDAFISCGNTGALMVGATMIVGTMKSISRPALLALIPTKSNLTAILDVGASVAYTSDHLVQFALLGAAFQKARGIKNPRVGLLNIGTEQKKGTFQHQKANLELSKIKDHFNFAGNIEGKAVFAGKVDVLVTDGFTGNIFLKTSEGLASFVLDKIDQNFSSDQRHEIFDILKDLKKRLYYAEYPGALLIGSKKIVIKCHGYSSIRAIISAINGTIDLVKKDIISSIKSYLQ